MKIKTLAIAGIVVIALLAALLWLDVRLMSSRMASDSTVAASRSPSDALPAVSVTGLSVEGNDRMQRALQAELAQALANQPGVGAVETRGSTTAQGAAVINVHFVERDVFWTPFYARSQLHVHAAYASDGDTSFDTGETPHFASAAGDPPAVRFLASYALADVSWGLMSQPGYQEYLAEQIASRVRASVAEQITQG